MQPRSRSSGPKRTLEENLERLCGITYPPSPSSTSSFPGTIPNQIGIPLLSSRNHQFLTVRQSLPSLPSCSADESIDSCARSHSRPLHFPHTQSSPLPRALVYLHPQHTICQLRFPMMEAGLPALHRKGRETLKPEQSRQMKERKKEKRKKGKCSASKTRRKGGDGENGI